MAHWNPAQYAKFLKDRTRPAIDLAHRLDDPAPESILDLGCGPGNSSRVLKDTFPGAKVTGADNSEEMLEKARSLYNDIEFIYLDANGGLAGTDKKYDIVFSNACIQWIPDHRRLLPELMSLLDTGGTLAVQIPMQSKLTVMMILERLACSDKWKTRIAPRQKNILSTEEYFDILSDISDDFEIWETVYCHRMPDCESIVEWYKGTGLRPYLEQLSEPDAKEFLDDFSEMIRAEFKQRGNGEILFRFPRLFFTAKAKNA